MSSCCSTPLSALADSSVAERRAAARHWLRLGLAALIAGQSMVFSFAVNTDTPDPSMYWVLHGLLAGAAVAVFLLVGLPMARSAWQRAWAGQFTVEQFFLTGVLGAFAASVTSSLTREGDVYYEVVAVLLAIYSLGRIVGDRQRHSALASASALRQEFESCVRAGECGREESVPVSLIHPGDRVHVLAGAGVPVDGLILEGTALVSETPLNGEPFPVVKRPGDRVRAGSHVLDAALWVEASHEGRTREIDRLLESVESSVRGLSPLQREADRIVAWFLPAVLGLSLLTAVGWTWHSGWVVGLFNGLAVLVVACPCAMGLATPIALWTAVNALARRGLVPRQGDFVERLAAVDTVVFDKTGTLSEEHLHVIDWVEAPGIDRQLLEAEVATVQAQVAHPVARAFRGWSGSAGVALDGGVETLAAVGIAARIRSATGSHRIDLGNEALVLETEKATLDRLKAQLVRSESAPLRWVVIRRDHVLAGVALLRENLRASAPLVIRGLQELHLDVRVMTGDRAEQAAALDLPGVQAGLSGVDKAGAVRDLQQAGHRVLFVGDGVNDAPAMACAHASVALVSGAALSREAADAQLFGSDLGHLAEAIRMSRTTVRRIRQNLLIAAIYNVLGITLAMSGYLHPIAAAVLMLLSSATVSFRALRGDAGTVRDGVSPVARPQWVPGRSWIGGLAAGAMGIQGLGMVYLGSFTGWMAAALAGSFAAAGCLLWSLRRHWLGLPYRTAFIAMLTLGNAGMLAGWWGDADWGQAVRDGLCLCGCTPGHFVTSLKSGVGWMHLGMVLGALPGFWWEGHHRVGPWRWDGRWLVCLAFMWLGMHGGAWLVMGAFTGQPQLQLLATYTAMTGGMFCAMLVVCGPRLLQESRKGGI